MKILKENFQLPRKGMYVYWNEKRFPVYYSDRVDMRFWQDMIYSAISDYVEEFGYAIEFFLGGIGFYIFSDTVEDFKVRIQADTKNYVVVDYGTAQITQGNEVVSKDFITYEQLIYAVIECFDRFVATGHIKEVQERPEADTEKVRALKLMHGIMQGMNNENAYDSWIMIGVPDGASEDDYVDIASDEDEYNDIVNSFNRIFKRYAKDGLFKPSTEEAQFAKEKCKELGISDIEILGESLSVNSGNKGNKNMKIIKEDMKWADNTNNVDSSFVMDGALFKNLISLYKTIKKADGGRFDILDWKKTNYHCRVLYTDAEASDGIAYQVEAEKYLPAGENAIRVVGFKILDQNDGEW